MNDLDDLKDALSRPPDFTPRALDLDAVLTTGARIRRRRRLAVAATTALTVVALLVGGNLIAQRTAPERPAATQTEVIIRTGLKEGGGEWVLYPQPIEGTPEITFGLMLGKSVNGGKPVDGVMANETDGSDRSPGFHAVQGGMTIGLGRTPTFGYYAGPATRITAKVDGRTVTAKQAPLDDSLQAFWFEAETVKDLAAYDAAGERLPAGNATPGVG